MTDTPDTDRTDEGEFSRSYLFISDPHFMDSYDAKLDYTTRVLDYFLDQEDFDGVVVGGDIGKKQALHFLNLDCDEVRAVIGDEDEKFWELDEVDDYLDEHVSLDSEHEWEDEDYLLRLLHDPKDYSSAFDNGRVQFDGGEQEPFIFLTGHIHMPHDTVNGQGNLCINAGSIWRNYQRKNRAIPRRSLYTIELGDQVRVRHYDFGSVEKMEKDKRDEPSIVEETVYEIEDNQFVEKDSEWGWDGPRLENRFHNGRYRGF